MYFYHRSTGMCWYYYCFFSDLVKISDDFVEKTETFHSLVIPLQLNVKLSEVCDRCKHHAHILTPLVVQLLPVEGATS